MTEHKGGKLARSAAMLCANPKFHRWLDRRRSIVNGTHDEQMATEWLRKACKVDSRAQLDHDEYGAAMFNKIMRTFLQEAGGDS